MTKLLHKIFFILFVILLQSKAAIDWVPVDEKITDKIRKGYFTGCVLGVYTNNSTLYKKAYGTLFKKYDLYAPHVTLDTIFDIGYLTQVIGINSVLMELFDIKKLHVTDKVSKHMGEFDNNGKQNITIQNLLLHNSGLQSTIPYPYGVPTELIKRINTQKLIYKTDSKYLYSELGPIVLGEMIQKITKKGLNQSVYQFLHQSGFREIYYKPNVSVHLIAPYGFHDSETTRGMPQNNISYVLGGVAGNAGLFSAIDNVGEYMQLVLSRGKLPLKFRIFTEEAVNLFTTRVDMKQYQNTRALGWETVPTVDPPCGKHFSKNSFGLSEASGSYVWADKDKNITIVLLAAGGYPVLSGLNIAKAQGEISDQIMQALGF